MHFVELVLKANVGERKSSVLSVYLSLPLARGMHFRHGNDLPNLDDNDVQQDLHRSNSPK